MQIHSQNDLLLMDIDKLAPLSWRSPQLVAFYLAQTDFLLTAGDIHPSCRSWHSKRELRLEFHYAAPNYELF